MSKPAARIGDMHVCPMVTPGTPPVPHVGGPITGPGVPTVLIGNMPAAVMGDMCTCVGPPDSVILGSTGVLIGSKPAARMGDMTAHGGSIVMGCPTVLIGEISPGTVTTKTSLTILEQFSPLASGVAQQVLAMQQAADVGKPFCEVCTKNMQDEGAKEDDFEGEDAPDNSPDDEEVRGTKKSEFMETCGKDTEMETKEDLWKQYKAEDWEGMEALINKKGINGGWPPNDGFQSREVVELDENTEIDRYDGDDPTEDKGRFASPKGDNFEGRAMPESSKDRPKYNYVVSKKIKVVKGKAIPWFGQKGGGMQYETKEPFKDLIDKEKIKVV